MTVTIVTQTGVRPESEDAFEAWQQETSARVSGVPGFLEQRVLKPNPPTQPEWVILQRFTDLEAAQTWLHSEERADRLETVAPMLVGVDDVNVVRDGEGALPAPASAVFSTRVRQGMEAQYQKWERRIAAAQALAPGFQGYRLEPPVPGVQPAFVAILRFDNEDNLQSWLNSDTRQALLKETDPFIENWHVFVAKTGFDQWFGTTSDPGAAIPPAWKMNMMVLLMLYPVVFIFGYFVGTPILTKDVNLPFAMALFVGNCVSVTLLTWLVPWVVKHFQWWLRPHNPTTKTNLTGVAVLLCLYAVMIVLFWQLF